MINLETNLTPFDGENSGTLPEKYYPLPVGESGFPLTQIFFRYTQLYSPKWWKTEKGNN